LHGWKLGGAVIFPFGSGSLRVKIENDDAEIMLAEGVARCRAIVVLPTPPFWLTRAITFINAPSAGSFGSH